MVAGYVSALVEAGFRVVTMDARGHGLSDKPHEATAYTVQARVGDIIAVLDAVGEDRVDYWGYSMGGWIGFALLRSRTRSVCADSWPARPQRLPAPRFEMKRSRLSKRWRPAIPDASPQGDMPAEVATNFVAANDLEALAALQRATMDWHHADLTKLTTPSLALRRRARPIVGAGADGSSADAGRAVRDCRGQRPSHGVSPREEGAAEGRAVSSATMMCDSRLQDRNEAQIDEPSRSSWWRRGSARLALPVLISVSTNDRRLRSSSSTDAAHPSRCTLRQQLEGTDGHPVLRRPRPILTTPRHRRRRVGGRFEHWLSEATVLIEGGPLADVGAIHCR